MKLDSRLMAIANLVRKDKIFADIGTDHAYLPVYLVEKGIIKKAIAADLRVGPLENAESPIVVTLLPIVTLLRLSQPENAESLITVTLSGIVTFARLSQPENAEPPITVTLSGVVTLVSLSQS